MDARQWLNELQTELFQRRLPRRYVKRLIRELSDHVLDDQERPMSTDAPMLPGAIERLGSPRTIAISAEQEFQRRRFAARHPILMFCVCPVLLLPVIAVACFFVPAWLIGSVLEGFGLDQKVNDSPWFIPTIHAYMTSTLLLASVLVVLAFSGLARRCAVRPRWIVASGLLVAILCGCTWSQVTPRTANRQGTLILGLTFPVHQWSIRPLLQFAAPMAMTVWMLKRSRREPEKPIADGESLSVAA